jgi:hypothetical protein
VCVDAYWKENPRTLEEPMRVHAPTRKEVYDLFCKQTVILHDWEIVFSCKGVL